MNIKNKKINKRKAKYHLFDYFNIVIMVTFCITIIFPFWDMIVRSLSDPTYASSLKMVWWPKGFTLDSYKFLLSSESILSAYGNTIARTLLGTLLALLVTVFLAYPLSKADLPFGGAITIFFIIPMFIGAGLIPTYILNRRLGLVNNFLVYILPGALNVYQGLLVRNFFKSMDKGLEESAFLDGANYFTILFRIMIPLAKPILATVALWRAVEHWNAWFDALIYDRTGDLEVISLLLRRMMDSSQTMNSEMAAYAMLANRGVAVTSNTLRQASTIIVIIPIMMVYPFLQKYFVKGIMVGSLKG